MGYRNDVALVLWKPDFFELANEVRKYTEKGTSCVWDMVDTAKTITTPDEQYVLMRADLVKWDSYSDVGVEVTENFIRDKRHSFVRIGEDNCDVEIDIKTDDSRGCDEEFDYWLGVERKIVIDEGIGVYE